MLTNTVGICLFVHLFNQFHLDHLQSLKQENVEDPEARHGSYSLQSL